jgi:glycosyltransferase involved in cell wall biosynthesis
LKILVVCPDFHPAVGGYAHAGTTFVRALGRSGRADVTVVTWAPLRGAAELASAGVTVQRFRRLPEFRYSILLDQVRLGLHLRRLLRRGGFDFALFETFENPIAQALALRRCRDLRRIGVRIHGCTETEILQGDRRWLGALYRALQRKVARRVPNIFSTTVFYKEWFKARVLGADATATFKNYCVVPNCVDAAPPRPASGPPGALDFLCLGRLNEVGYNQKNFELVAQALAILKRTRADLYPRIRVRLVGGGERKADLQAVLGQLGVATRCELVDGLPNAQIHDLQAAASACILVSRYEGMSMFALEALANGAPLILSRNTGVSELVRDGENGFLVDGDDPFDLASAMERIAAADLAALRAASRRRFEMEYDPARVAERFWTCVDLCLASRK